jgi:hypothetical protein
MRGKLNLWSATLLGSGKNRNIYGAIFFLVLLCFTGCDSYNQSIEDFIYHQTGAVLSRDQARVIAPEAEQDPDGAFHIRAAEADIIVELDLENDRGYELRLSALNNGAVSEAVRAEQTAPERVLIRIAGAKPGDVFRLVLQAGAVDGYRSFGEIHIPAIYCDAPASVYNIDITPSANGTVTASAAAAMEGKR